MTLSKLIERLQDVLAQRPENGDLPVYLSRKKNRRTTEYIPVQYVMSGRLTVGTAEGGELTMIQAATDHDASGVIEHHSYGAGAGRRRGTAS